MTDNTRTAEELAAEERQAAIARGDLVDDEAVADEAVADEAVADEAVADEAVADEVVADEAVADEKAKPIMIPKARFDEAAQKAKDKVAALQTKLDTLEKSHARKTTDADLSALEKSLEELEDKYETHLLEGELEQARAVRHDMRDKRKVIAAQEALQQSQATGNAAVEQIRFDHQLAAIEAAHPELNPDHESANPELIQEVIDMMQTYQKTGFTATAALQKAVHYVVRPTGAEGKDISAEKNKQALGARTAAAAAAAASPPNLNKAGKDSDKGGKGSDGMPDVSRMSPAQFAKWLENDPSAVARMRGDSLSSSQEAA